GRRIHRGRAQAVRIGGAPSPGRAHHLTASPDRAGTYLFQERSARTIHWPDRLARPERDTVLSRVDRKPGAPRPDHLHADRRFGVRAVQPYFSALARAVPL